MSQLKLCCSSHRKIWECISTNHHYDHKILW